MQTLDVASLTYHRYTARTAAESDWYLRNILDDDRLLQESLARRGLTSVQVDRADPEIDSLLKDHGEPKAEFVLATGCGNPGRDGLGRNIAEAQLAINDAKTYPKFAGNVKAVDSRDL